MPKTANPSRHCSHLTRAGQPCRAWAVRGTDPPLCVAHGGAARRAPTANQNARKHGFYSTALLPQEITDLITYAGEPTLDDEIAITRVALRRLHEVLTPAISGAGPELAPLELSSLTNAAFNGARTLDRLLRSQARLAERAQGAAPVPVINALEAIGRKYGLLL